METYCARTLQGVNGGPERGGVVPQTTHLMEDRVVTFQLPAVLSEMWAGMSFPTETAAVSPLPPSLPCSHVRVSLVHTWPSVLCRYSLRLQVPFPRHQAGPCTPCPSHWSPRDERFSILFLTSRLPFWSLTSTVPSPSRDFSLPASSWGVSPTSRSVRPLFQECSGDHLPTAGPSPPPHCHGLSPIASCFAC